MKAIALDGAAEPTEQAILLCREYAMEQLEEAQNNDVYVCGMQAFDADHLMHGVIIAREGLECHHPMEFEYYNTTIKNTAFNASLCAYCAGSSGANGIFDEMLSVEWKSVLLLCTSCAASGAIPLTRTRRRNGAANGQRAKRARQSVPSIEAHDPSAPNAHARPQAPIASGL